MIVIYKYNSYYKCDGDQIPAPNPKSEKMSNTAGRPTFMFRLQLPEFLP